MALLTSAQKKKARELCRKRDGDQCSIKKRCDGIGGDEYRKQTGRDFDLHHKDRNPENNPADGSNHALACHACNCANDPRGKTTKPKFSAFRHLKKGMSERTWEEEKEFKWSQARIKPATMKKNEKAEPVFRKKVEEVVGTLVVVRRKDLIDGCSEAAECSQAAGSRYLDKLCSFFGKYEYVGKDDKGGYLPLDSIGEYEGEIYVRLKAETHEVN